MLSYLSNNDTIWTIWSKCYIFAFLNLYLIYYCYRHNLARPGGGPRSKMGSKDNCSGLANQPLRGRLRPGLAMYLDRCVGLK
jgi:hypothetical protein